MSNEVTPIIKGLKKAVALIETEQGESCASITWRIEQHRKAERLVVRALNKLKERTK